MADREEQRQRELVRQFTLKSAKAEKGIYFVTEYLRENLTYPKTETLSSLRSRLDHARRPSSISETSVNVLNSTNEALDGFVRDNALLSDYARIVATFGRALTNGAVIKAGFRNHREDQSGIGGTRRGYGVSVQFCSVSTKHCERHIGEICVLNGRRFGMFYPKRRDQSGPTLVSRADTRQRQSKGD